MASMHNPDLDVIEGEVREIERGLSVVPDGAMAAVGALAIADLTDVEFDRRLASLAKGRDRMARMQRTLMTQDVDYGTIPGTPKPTLLKPGAEKLCFAYGLVADFAPQRVLGDGRTGPHLAYQTRCNLHLGSLDGPIVAVGYGSANSWERKHRYRSGERVCPSCGKSGSIIKGKAEYGGGWLCFAKKGGCGSKFGEKDQAILGQIVGDVENADPWDLDTTLLKMAEKRAHVDATLRGTAASGLFTQDVEDAPAPVDGAPAATKPSPPRQRASRPQAAQPPPPSEDDIDGLFRASLPVSPPADPDTGEVLRPPQTPQDPWEGPSGADAQPADDRPDTASAGGLTSDRMAALLREAGISTDRAREVRADLFPGVRSLDDAQRGDLYRALMAEHNA